MKIVVITGSTRGIGYGLADSFLSRGCSVVVSGRRQEIVDKATSTLADKYDAGHILGQACDVTEPDQVQVMWNAAATHFGRVDIWINNAGLAHPQLEFQQIPPETMSAVVGAKMLGTMYGCRVALKGMLAQGSGALYIMGGHGTTGRKQDGLSLYGTTNYGLHYLFECLVGEAKSGPVIVGELRPGMVITDMITDQFTGRPEEWERMKGVLNIIADRVDTVAPWLVDRILANKKNGAQISWLTRPKIISRFLMAPFRKRQIV